MWPSGCQRYERAKFSFKAVALEESQTRVLDFCLLYSL
uniref:Uncharacterized protein n=1 Tax=Anguilla anguilla TaxID=7936 RepID=A0A0E9Q007_ANGAN